MAPMTNRVKVWKYFWGLFIGTNNFAFEVEVILVRRRRRGHSLVCSKESRAKIS